MAIEKNKIEEMKFQNIIKSILLDIGYEVLDTYDDIEVFSYVALNKQHFYILTNNDNLLSDKFDFDSYQVNVYEKITRKPIGFEKNASWIIGTCVDGDQNIDNILLIEEDEYYFRKLVFYYTEEEIQCYHKEVKSKQSQIEFLNDFILKSEKYNEYIENKNVLYSFISKIFIKITSLKFPDFIVSNSADIEKRIEDSIENDKNINTYNELKNNIEKIDEYLENNDIKNIIQMLKNIAGDDDDK